MKKLVCLAAMAAMFSTGFAQDDRETVEGNGKAGSKSFPVTSFDALKVSGVFEVELKQGSTEGVKLEADENLLQYVSVHNEGSTLVIDMDKLKHKNFKSKTKLKLWVDFKNLKTLESGLVGSLTAANSLRLGEIKIINHGVGNIKLNIEAQSLSLKNSGVGSISLEGSAQSAELVNSGVGSIKAGGFVVQSMNVENSGIGSAEVNAVKEIKARSTGMGSVRNKGAAPMPKKQKAITI